MLLLQVPPVVALVNVDELNSQIVLAPVIAVRAEITVTTAVPVIALVHPPMVLVAEMLYVPAIVCDPKLSADPVPDTGEPAAVLPLYN